MMTAPELDPAPPAQSTAEPPPLGQLLDHAWPEGLSDQNQSRMRKLSAEDELLVRMRLNALLEVDAGERPATRPPAGDPRGLTASGFQSLVRRWRADRSVQTLVPYAGRTPRIRDDTPDHRLVAREIDELLRSDPDASLVAVAKAALRRSGASLAINTIRSLTRERREILRSEPEWLARNYGKNILLDVSALGLSISADDGDTIGAIALLVECSSGIVLGHAIGHLDEAPALQRSAIADGLTKIISEGIDVDGDPAKLTLVIAPGESAAYAAALREVSPTVTIIDSPRRRPGDRVAELVNGAIDILPLRPRGGRAARRSQSSTWDAVRLAVAAEEAVSAYNQDRLECVKAAMSQDRLVSMGRMVEALRPVLDIA